MATLLSDHRIFDIEQSVTHADRRRQLPLMNIAEAHRRSDVLGVPVWIVGGSGLVYVTHLTDSDSSRPLRINDFHIGNISNRSINSQVSYRRLTSHTVASSFSRVHQGLPTPNLIDEIAEVRALITCPVT